MDNVVINGVEYEPVKNKGEELRINIIDSSGLTLVGYVDLSKDSKWITIRKSRCVIEWGVDKHLAQLVDGPLPGTVLGAVGDVEVNQIMASYKCKGDWYKDIKD